MKYNKNKKQPKLSKGYLLRSTYRYLEKYATTAANLKFILKRKADRILENIEEKEQLSDQVIGWVEEIVDDCLKNGLINDRLYAQSRANSLLLSGNSLNVIKNKLHAKGVPQDIISEVIAELFRDQPNVNIISAIKYARKRRFGPFRIKEEQDNTEKRELGAMARAGFSYNEAIKILKSGREELDDILYSS